MIASQSQRWTVDRRQRPARWAACAATFFCRRISVPGRSALVFAHPPPCAGCVHMSLFSEFRADFF